MIVTTLVTVVNIGSFNYGIPSDKGKVPSMYSGSHIRLDVEHTPDNDIRRKATKQYRSRPSNYADIVNAGGEKDTKFLREERNTKGINAYLQK